MDVTKRIFSLLKENMIDYEEFFHKEASTCEISSKARNIDLKYGGKTLLLKNKSGFHMFCLAANLNADNKLIRHILKSQKLRFATAEELLLNCGVVKGALPPLGRPLYPFDLYVDESIMLNDIIAFNLGILTHSIVIKLTDWKKITNFKIASFSKRKVNEQNI